MSTDVDLELVRELHPDIDASSQARARARDALLAAIGTSGQSRRQLAPARFRPRLLPSVGLLGASLAIAAAVVVAASVRGGAGQPASAAAAMLQRAARVAAASGGPRELRPGEYWYAHSREIVNGAVFPDPKGGRGHVLVIVNALTSYDRQDWIGVDRRGFYTTRVIGVHFLSAAARRQWERDGRPAPVSMGGRFFASGRVRPPLHATPCPTDQSRCSVQGCEARGRKGIGRLAATRDVHRDR